LVGVAHPARQVGYDDLMAKSEAKRIAETIAAAAAAAAAADAIAAPERKQR